MIYKLSDNIFSPLGNTTEQNLAAVKEGRAALETREWKDYPGSLTLSRFGRIQPYDGLSRMETIAAASARYSIASAGIQDNLADAVLILSTAKGNINLLQEDIDFADNYLGASALRVARACGIANLSITVCNACASGSAALILALRMLKAGLYKYAVVVGAEEIGKFIISGFDAIGALSREACRPFDIERTGLNLGEAAASMVLSADDPGNGCWAIRSGAVRNDAYGTTAPSKDARGLRLAIATALGGWRPKRIKMINAHGTATLFNDQMESVAIERMRLSDVPLNAYKGTFGHTLGAAGLLETILSMAAADDSCLLPTNGFLEKGVSGNITINDSLKQFKGRTFLKTISGFGGCNAAIVATKRRVDLPERHYLPLVRHTASVRISPAGLWVGETRLYTEGEGSAMLTDIYRRYCASYVRFFKMDMLSRLGYLASELLLRGGLRHEFRPRRGAGTGVILFNRSSSIDTDRKYLKTLTDGQEQGASPSLFVYTLPSIVTGEIAIRNTYLGETSFYVLPDKHDAAMDVIIRSSFLDRKMRCAVCGWVDWESETNFYAELYLVARQKTNDMENLILELKEQLIEVLNLEGMKPEEIDADAPLFGEGLGLDSIDALELIVLMEKKYGVKLANPAEGKVVFRNLRTMAQYITEHRTK